MDIWLDTTHIPVIHHATKCGLLSGVTTNPALIAESGKGIEEVLEGLLHHQKGPVAAQVVATDTSEMVRQGETLHAMSNRLIIKVPVTKNGLKALHVLSKQGIPTMATVIFHPHQALLAALAGANYAAPYLGRIEKEGFDPWDALKNMLHLYATYRFKTKILGASLQSVEQVMKCAEAGIYGVTVKDDLFEKLIDNDPLTLKAVEQFQSYTSIFAS